MRKVIKKLRIILSTSGIAFILMRQPVFAQEVPPQMPPIQLKPGIFDQAINFLYLAYGYVREAVIFLLQQTIFKGNPKLATFYGEAAAFLASVTSIYIILELFTGVKRVVKYLLICGWILFLASVLIRVGILK